MPGCQDLGTFHPVSPSICPFAVFNSTRGNQPGQRKTNEMSTANPQRDPVRPRGRPCKPSSGTVDAERRKQIREAQRTYRSRQQSLLTSLKERNAQLEDVVGQLSQIMLSFHQTKADPALPLSKLPEAVELLEHSIAQQLKRVQGNTIEEDRNGSVQSSRFQQKMQQLIVRPSMDFSKTPISSPPSISPQSSSPFWSSFLKSSHPLIPSTLPSTCGISVDLSAPLINSSDQTIPYTTTRFTQKLFHACAKTGHRFLTSDAVSDNEMWHEFGLVLQSMPRAQVASYFKRVLAAVPCNPVEDFQFPFISLGGAGTHYPRAKQISIGTSGLQNLLPFQTTNGIREIHSDQEWFDVHDVEGFLSSRGILLESNQLLISSPALLETQPLQIEEFLHDKSETGSLPFGPSLSGIPTLSIDEDTLISELSRLCICIGCAAAFRRSDVESLVFHTVRHASPTNVLSMNV